MIDIKLLQKDFDTMSAGLQKKGVTAETLASLKTQVEDAKEKRKEMESSQAEQKKLSQQFGSYKKEGKDVAPLQEKIGILKQRKQELEDAVREIETSMQNIAMGIPNLPDDVKRILSEPATPKVIVFAPLVPVKKATPEATAINKAPVEFFAKKPHSLDKVFSPDCT